MLKYLLLALILSAPLIGEKLPVITPRQTTAKMKQILAEHASYKEIDTTLAKRALSNFIDELDPNKTYFIQSDIIRWIEPEEFTLQRVVEGYQNSDFTTFFEILDKMTEAISRRRNLEKNIDFNNLPENVNPSEFKDLQWAQSEEELLSRLSRIRALQVETTMKLTDELKDKALQRLARNQERTEQRLLTKDPIEKERLVLSRFLKAMSSSLDTHTSYFTPDEASQFVISVQQRLFGIGAQLRDDLNGLTIIKVIEGGPAAASKELKVKDRIVAVDDEPVVGMDISDAVEMIRGPEGTPVTLTIIREVTEEDKTREVKKKVKIIRGEVILKETRYESSWEPFGDGVIAYLRLFSFYQDPENSSTLDLQKELEKIQKEHTVKGVILDLRSNSGGLLSQAVSVTGLFITKGVVVTILDSSGQRQVLRDTDGKTIWDGPLVVLINRASASASEIVAQTLQDYGRAIIVGDDHSYGKGSFQTFTLNTGLDGGVNPQGEYKVTRGRYYTVSGKTPQLHGVASDVVAPGVYSESEIGEKHAKYPLQADSIEENFNDDLSDIPFAQRQKVRLLYKFNLQQKINTYTRHLEQLKGNSAYRIEKDKNYQNFLKELKKQDVSEEDTEESFGKNDMQLNEAYNVIKDLILITQ